MRNMLKAALVLVIGAVLPVVFVASCVIAASDGQGAIVFLATIPVSFILIGLGVWAAGKLPRAVGLAARALLAAYALFLIAFLAGTVVPPLRPWTRTVFGFVGDTFEGVTGLSPYAWSRRNDRLAGALRLNLSNATVRLTADDVSPGRPWARLCVFGPYTDDAAAAPALGFLAATLERSRVRHSDAVTALVYLDDENVAIEVVDVPRTPVDLASLSGRCFTPADFPIALREENGVRRPDVPPPAVPQDPAR